MRLEKYHGLGNDFLVLLDLGGNQTIAPAQAVALCDRRRGVGADGLIRVTSGPTMELYNADGGRAEMSGNGIRCLAQALVDSGLEPGPEMTIRTDTGDRRVTVFDDGRVMVEMGKATIVDGPGRALSVDMGNPHVVVSVDDPSILDLVEEAGCFPGVNVEFVAAGPGPDALTMRVWERGVGETQACGTGACAAAAAAQRWGLVGRKVTVHQPGGPAEVHLGDDTIRLTGSAVHIASVEVADRLIGVSHPPLRQEASWR